MGAFTDLIVKPLSKSVGVVIISPNKSGEVNKKFTIFGKEKSLPDGKIVALNGEPGIQAEMLTPNIYFGKWPWQYEVSEVEYTTIDSDSLGIVKSRDGGNPADDGRVLGKSVESDNFQNVRAFLNNGGERGTQIAFLPPGVWRINTQVFDVVQIPIKNIANDRIGIVTTREGKELPKGDIAGPIIPGHNSFQDGQAFVESGGYKGTQEQVLMTGRYFINPEFATVVEVSLTEVPIAHVGVVISFVGKQGVDVSGEHFKHGNIVKNGEKGVWIDPLDPGKYPINPFTHRVEGVPTANVVLNWATGKSEAHKLDANLSTITVRSSDGFTFNLDVSQIIHIPRNDAPKVIARFGSMSALVTQVLEPIIGNYFRNAAQKSDAIAFLKERSQRQEEARAEITLALSEYNVIAVDTLIGNIVPPPELMKTLTDRKIAEQEKVTFEIQREAQKERANYEQDKALADTSARVVDSERKVAIAKFEADAQVKTAEGNAKAKTVNATADAEVTKVNGNAQAVVTKVTGEAEAGKILAIGNAEAEVTKRKIESMEAGNYANIAIAQALGESGQKIVPEIIVNGGSGSTSGTFAEILLGNLTLESIKKKKESSEPPIE